MQAKTRNTIIAGIFTVAVFMIGFVGFSDAVFNSANMAVEKTQDSSKLAVKNITQTASAQNPCAGSYGKNFGGGNTCYRSGSTTYIAVLSASSVPPALSVNAVNDSYEVEEGGSFQASGSGGDYPSVLANDTPGGISVLEVQSWDTSGVQGTTSSTQDNNGNFDYNAPANIGGATTTTTFNYTATDGTSTDTATGTITITPPSCANGPDANDDTGIYSVNKGEVLDTDADGFDSTYNNDSNVSGATVTITDSPQFGNLTFDDNTGHFVYDHTANNTNQDSFEYRLADGSCTDTAEVTIDVSQEPPVAQIDGPDAINFCESDSSQLEYDGSSSYDQDQGGASITDYNWGLVTAPTSTSLTSTNGPTTRFSQPVDWSGTSTLGLVVTDNEGSTDSTSTQVTVNVPDYIIDEDNIEPEDRRIWITASSTKRSTKATIPVEDFTDSDFNYDFDDIYLTFSDKAGIATSSMQWERATSSNAFKFWVKPQSESEELAFGTYEITVNATLDIGAGNSCVYSEPAANIDLRAQTTAEF